MTLSWMGMFRTLFSRENRVIRYLADSSYWLYLSHLPVIILAQGVVSYWAMPAIVKVTLISVVVTGMLLFVYETLVRYTWVGAALNGPRTRPETARAPEFNPAHAK
jgi:glucan biosynthesis protein C